MVYLFKNVVVRNRREVNDIFKYFTGDDCYDSSVDETTTEEEMITFGEWVKVYPDSFEVTVNDGNDSEKVINMDKYRVELWYWNTEQQCASCLEIIDSSNEISDPEEYMDHCEYSGDEIRIYDNLNGRLIDSYEYNVFKETDRRRNEFER